MQSCLIVLQIERQKSRWIDCIVFAATRACSPAQWNQIPAACASYMVSFFIAFNTKKKMHAFGFSSIIRSSCFNNLSCFQLNILPLFNWYSVHKTRGIPHMLHILYRFASYIFISLNNSRDLQVITFRARYNSHIS